MQFTADMETKASSLLPFSSKYNIIDKRYRFSEREKRGDARRVESSECMFVPICCSTCCLFFQLLLD
uniref:Ovule protein n=1 Tax=Ascaris lumbricoides TaxID=6252 RepID=A0A0M3HL00_ASCLU